MAFMIYASFMKLILHKNYLVLDLIGKSNEWKMQMFEKSVLSMNFIFQIPCNNVSTKTQIEEKSAAQSDIWHMGI